MPGSSYTSCSAERRDRAWKRRTQDERGNGIVPILQTWANPANSDPRGDGTPWSCSECGCFLLPRCPTHRGPSNHSNRPSPREHPRRIRRGPGRRLPLAQRSVPRRPRDWALPIPSCLGLPPGFTSRTFASSTSSPRATSPDDPLPTTVRWIRLGVL